MIGFGYNRGMHGGHPAWSPWTRKVTTAAAWALGVACALHVIRGLMHPSSLDAAELTQSIAQAPSWWVGCLPFGALLACMALLPLIGPVEHWWESNRSKAALSCALGLAALWWIHGVAGSEGAQHAALHGAAEYVPFIVLLLSLYVIAGGVRLEGRLAASTLANTTLLGTGAVLANLLGTTGASMLLITPLLRANAHRTHRVHTVVFFIFLVSNVGGCLLPIGDPPLFLGFLRGVPFLWTTSLWKEWLVAVAALLILYAVLDRQLQRRERPESAGAPGGRVRVHGWPSVGLLLIAVLVVAVVQHGRPLPLLGFEPPMLGREVALLALAGLSLGFEPWKRRVEHGFSLAPMGEVAALFAGIFLAMQVPLAVLGAQGAQLALDAPWKLFWATGSLSSVLDNAPTYVVFLEVARGVTLQVAGPDTVLLAGDGWVRHDLLTGVSLGAVFMGAMTYIGNGPNLMVRAIAAREGVRMPGFGGYVAWACVILLPVFAAVSWMFLR
jgi:Na+/H+ antiporter NhaD/arsenite permease-like protein